MVAIIMMIRVEAKDGFENIVKEMQMEMNERFALTEEKRMKTQTELLELKTENVQLKKQINKTKQDPKNTKNHLQTQCLELEKEVSFRKEPPFFLACGYKFSISITQQTIPYDSLLYSTTNRPGGDLAIKTCVLVHIQ